MGFWLVHLRVPTGATGGGNMRVVKGDLLDSRADFVIQQNNCVTLVPKGLSAAIAQRFSYCHVYSKRQPGERDVPGTFETYVDAEGKHPAIVCLFAQLCPGKPGAYAATYRVSPKDDTAALRLVWFERALRAFLKTAPKGSLALPYGIGCGLAGGDWATYRACLERVERDCSVEFVVYQNE